MEMRLIKQAGRLDQFLSSRGVKVREVKNVSEVDGLLGEIQKPYLTPMSAPSHNDFTPRNALWLVAERDSRPIMLGCARLEDLGAMSVSDYWQQVFRRAYGGASKSDVLESVAADIPRWLSGRLVYFGDLYVGKSDRRSIREVRSFVALGHVFVSLRWNPDWTYCFLRERDIMRGAASSYGFNYVSPNPLTWRIEPPDPRCASEWLAAVSRQNLHPMLEAILPTGE